MYALGMQASRSRMRRDMGPALETSKTPSSKSSIKPLELVWNFVHTIHICYPTKFDISDSMKSWKVKFEVLLSEIRSVATKLT